MGPALIEPDHRPARRPGRARQAWPQWGRLSSSRITEHRPAGDDRGDGRNGAGSHRAGSHMWPLRNPCRHKRRNGAGSHRAGSPERQERPSFAREAAMGPALIEPDHPGPAVNRSRLSPPQWGRLSSSRITPNGTPAPTSDGKSRNGAGSHRAGSRPDMNVDPQSVLLPQWGRLSSSRITDGRTRRPGVRGPAAMGPALIEPDHFNRSSLAANRCLAAMGPALIEPDHGCPRCRTR